MRKFLSNLMNVMFQTLLVIVLSKGLRIISIIIVSLSLYQIYKNTKYKSSQREDQLLQKDTFRSLFQIESELLNHTDNDCESIPLKTSKLIEYEFILNITQYPYKGQWSTFQFPNNKFINDKGRVEYSIIKGFNKYSTHNSISPSLIISLILKDGNYIDNFFMANITFILPYNISRKILSSTKSLKPITLSSIPCELSLYNGNLFENKRNTIINTTSISISFYPIESIFSDSNYLYSSRNLWSKASMAIEDKDKRINIELNSDMHDQTDKTIQIFTYSLIITVITIFQISSSVTFLLDINENTQLACNAALITLSIQIFHDSLICSSHFYITVSNDKYSIYFGICSMVYFILFSVFELHILFCCWKARFNYLLNTDITLFRKKLIQFYLVFYIILFSSMISLSFWFDHFGLSYMFFSSTWLFQIIHSVQISTKPSMRYEYILWFTLGKIVFPLYIKGYPYNVFELRPEYIKVYAISLITVIEACIVMLQKALGPKFFIPKGYRYNNDFCYYKTYEELIDNSNECVICLEPLKNKCLISKYLHQNEEEAIIEKRNKGDDKQTNDINDIITNYILVCVYKCKEKRQKKDYMITPCYHEFHTQCLEKWIDCKSECPYCRRMIPSLDD